MTLAAHFPDAPLFNHRVPFRAAWQDALRLAETSHFRNIPSCHSGNPGAILLAQAGHRFGMVARTMDQADDPREYVLRTAKENDVKFIRMWFTDILGTLKGFAITVAELEGALERGMAFDGSAIEGFARMDESDMVAMPDPTTFSVLPWRPRQNAVARIICDVLRPNGDPFEGDPRYVLKRNLERASQMGFTFMVGPEMEHFYFKDQDSTEPLDVGGYFDNTPLDNATNLRRETVLTLEEMGIPVEYSHHEGAHSQHEIDLRHTDALTMADAVMTYRLVVKEVAMRHGVYATFMPRPLADQNGNGMHVNQSLFRGEQNTFYDADDPHKLSETGHMYIAGLLRHAPENRLRLLPVGELLQALASRLRGSYLHLLGPREPGRPGARPGVPARQGGVGQGGVPAGGPHVQSIPSLFGHARGWAHRHREGVRARATGGVGRAAHVGGGAAVPGDHTASWQLVRGGVAGGAERATGADPWRAHLSLLHPEQAHRVGPL